MNAKVTKIMIFPERTIGLPGFSSAKLSAGLEVKFDKPVPLDSKEIRKAYDKAREITKDEMKRQFAPIKKQLKDK